MDTGGSFNMHTFPVHLGLGARVTRLPQFDGSVEWYQRYGEQTSDDGKEGRLVSLHTFSESWDTWEMHPNGEELVACMDGVITLRQELDEGEAVVTLHRGEAIVNPAGVWHTADVDAEATVIFITAGVGTELRPR